MLNDCHFGACGGHLSRMAIAQKILHAGYFWPSVFKYCHEAVKKCLPCQHFYPKKHTHPTLLHSVIVVGPFAKWGIDFMHCKPTSAEGHGYIIIAIGPFSKWGIDFMHCNPTSAEGHGYIIVAIDYFTKWAEAMPTYVEDVEYYRSFLVQSYHS